MKPEEDRVPAPERTASLCIMLYQGPATGCDHVVVRCTSRWSVTLVCRRRMPRSLVRDTLVVPTAVCGICAKLRAARSASAVLVLAAHQRETPCSGEGILVLRAMARPQPRDGATRAVEATAKLFDHDNCQTTQEASCCAERIAPVAEKSPTRSQWCPHRWSCGRIAYSAGTVAAGCQCLTTWTDDSPAPFVLPTPGKRTLQ